eukprot:NODE_4_length_77007_cov_1.156642.p16 type:complete len:442 gc:universal NODE_4_length_77007_cov_1.156642:27115-28440(+)
MSSTDQQISDLKTANNTSFLLISAALVFLMIPALGFFYSGLSREKSGLSFLLLCFLSVGVVFVEWYIWGYSLVFGSNSGPFIGNLNNAFLMDVGEGVTGGVYDLAYVLFQGMFAAITPALMLGAAAERCRILPKIVFVFIWSTLVYNPIAHWVWSTEGWLFKLRCLDFAGGLVVHIASGISGLSCSIFIGRRKDMLDRPHSVSSVVLGTALLWFGWCGFNGGSALAPNGVAALAFFNTNLAACSGALAFMLLDYIKHKKWSAIAFCSGAVAGLVGITPAAGLVSPSAGLLIGAVSGLGTNIGVGLKHKLRYDDTLDVFGIHAIGGIIGSLFTGIFAQGYYMTLGAPDPSIVGGVIDGNGIQFAYQLAATVTVIGYCFIVTYAILFVMDKIPRMSLRMTEENEEDGIDKCEIGEYTYEYIGDRINLQKRKLNHVDSYHMSEE